MKKLILISNDDGYQAKGINCLVDMVRDLADIVVCAPDGPRSGYACAFSATKPLTLTKQHEEEGLQVWSSNGTPVDCVKLALQEICPRRPDMVIGGTMGITLEGCMKYIPSVAFSLCDFRADADFEPMRDYVRRITRKVLSEGLPTGVCLNVNFPITGLRGTESEAPHYRGIKMCRMSKGTWGQEIVKCHHPRGYDYYWMVGHYVNDEPDAGDTDRWALDHGYVAVTPTRTDVTAYELMKELEFDQI